jgi:MoaA/NifB/PqqE/SkfB family radical SAM enzyme
MAKSPGEIEKKPLKRTVLQSRRLRVLLLRTFLRGYAPIEPIAVQIETTINCNLKCVHCERTYWPIQRFTDMTFDDFKKMVDGMKHAKSVSLTGIGEPLLNRDLLRMVKYAKERGMRVEFTTNATMINERTGPAIIESGVDLVAFSMESSVPETFEKIRVGAKFERIVSNISEFMLLKRKMKSQTPIVELRTVAMLSTVDEVPGLVRLAKQMGIKFVKVNPLVYEFKFGLETPEISKVLEMHEFSLRLGHELGVDVEWPLVEYGKFKPGACVIPYHTPYVFKEGLVAPCCLATQRNNRDEILKRYTFGNAITTPLGGIVNNRRFVKFRMDLQSSRFQDVPDLCKDCWMLQQA